MWPPPAEFVDPFLTSVRRNQEVDLGRIVDDVMGPNPRKRTGHTPSSFSSVREADRSVGAGGHGAHRKSGSGGSYARLLDEFGARQQSQHSRASSRSAYSDRYDPPEEHPGIGGSTAGYDLLPPGAAHVATHDLGHNPIVISPGTYSLRGPAGGPSVKEGLASKPRKLNVAR